MLLAECALQPNCTAWRDDQSNAMRALAAALDIGRQRFLAWLAAVESTARLCPLPDTGGLVATAATYPNIHKDIYGLPDPVYALVVADNLSVGCLLGPGAKQ